MSYRKKNNKMGKFINAILLTKPLHQLRHYNNLSKLSDFDLLYIAETRDLLPCS